MMGERTVQEIFDLAISRGFYTIDSTLSSSRYMCDSLNIMNKCSLLSDDEYLKTRKEINKYLSDLRRKNKRNVYESTFLYDTLKKLGVLSKKVSRQEAWAFLVSVYSDWENRPLI